MKTEWQNVVQNYLDKTGAKINPFVYKEVPRKKFVPQPYPEEDFDTAPESYTDVEEVDKFAKAELARLEDRPNPVTYRATARQYKKALQLLEQMYQLYSFQEKAIDDLTNSLGHANKNVATMRRNIDKAITPAKILFQLGPIVIKKMWLNMEPTDTLFGDRYCQNPGMHKPECDCNRANIQWNLNQMQQYESKALTHKQLAEDADIMANGYKLRLQNLGYKF